MFEYRDLKVLLGNSIREPEVDYDDEEVKSEIGYPVEEEALKEYYFVAVVDSMNTPEFKSEYSTAISKIKQYSTEQQLLLAFSILDYIPKKYDFDFSQKYNIYNQRDIDDLYSFLEFIEYDHEDFITSVWKNLNPNPKTLNIKKYCSNNSDKIIFEIEEHLGMRYMPEMIADFLRTNNKENLISWFSNKSSNLRSSILIELLQ